MREVEKTTKRLEKSHGKVLKIVRIYWYEQQREIGNTPYSDVVIA